MDALAQGGYGFLGGGEPAGAGEVEEGAGEEDEEGEGVEEVGHFGFCFGGLGELREVVLAWLVEGGGDGLGAARWVVIKRTSSSSIGGASFRKASAAAESVARSEKAKRQKREGDVDEGR